MEELEPALAECVAGLREIMGRTLIDGRAVWYRQIASKTLDRLQILGDDLPTKGYPDD